MVAVLTDNWLWSWSGSGSGFTAVIGTGIAGALILVDLIVMELRYGLKAFHDGREDIDSYSTCQFCAPCNSCTVIYTLRIEEL